MAMHLRSLALAILLLSGCKEGEPSVSASSEPAVVATDALASASAPAEPVLAACGPDKPEEGEGELERKKPLPIPPALAGFAVSNMRHIAVTRTDGSTACINTGWIESIERMKLLSGDTLFGFGWLGYEAYGYQLLDRRGKGETIEMGNPPAFSPSGHLLASVEQSESGFGGLNGAIVVQIEPGPAKVVGKIAGLPESFGDWRFDKWSGDTCFTLSAVAFDKAPEDGNYSAPNVPRERYIVRKGAKGWALEQKASCSG